MGLFSKSVSNADIDQVVMSHIAQYLGEPQNFGKPGFDQKYSEMLLSLRRWADEKKLSSWKKSSVIAGLEASLRGTLTGNIPSGIINMYVKKARYIILDCTW